MWDEITNRYLTSTLEPLKFENKWVISSHILMGTWTLIHFFNACRYQYMYILFGSYVCQIRWENLALIIYFPRLCVRAPQKVISDFIRVALWLSIHQAGCWFSLMFLLCQCVYALYHNTSVIYSILYTLYWWNMACICCIIYSSFVFM